ncbi:MAG: hemolysin family protein [Burkholderiales bacterium]
MEILIILFLIILNGVFAMSEIAVVSSRKPRLQQWTDEGDERAEAALALANDPGHFLSTIQVGITLIGILAGAVGARTLSEPLSANIAEIEALAPHSEAIALAIIVAAITYASLIIGELVPKRIALHHPESIASFMAKPMNVLSVIASPLVKFLSFSTDFILRMLGIRPSQEPPVTEEEIKVLLEQGTEAGVFEREEQELVHNIFRLDAQGVSSVMRPRLDIFYLDVEDVFEENRRKIIESEYSRFPVCRGGIDQVLGIVQSKDLLTKCLGGEPIDLVENAHQPLYVPDSISTMQLLQMFKQTSIHLALVVDEYGDLQGLATLNDVMEAIIGDISAAELAADAEAVQRPDGSWLLDGMLSIDKFKTLFDLDQILEEKARNYNTVGGFVMMQLGRVPKAADHFDWEDLRFEIMDMDRNRIDKILVRRRVEVPKS